MKIFREKAGVISKKRVWVAMTDEHMYIADHLPGLVWEIVVGWKKDRNLIG